MIRGGKVRLAVADVERAIRYYVETLGMKLVDLGSAHDEHAVIDAGDGLRIELVRDVGSPAPRSTVVLSPKVPLDEAVAILENRGVHFESKPPAEARFHDPDGHTLALDAG